MKNLVLSLGLASTLLIAACGKKEEAAAPAPAAPIATEAAAPAPAEAAAPVTTEAAAPAPAEAAAPATTEEKPKQ